MSHLSRTVAQATRRGRPGGTAPRTWTDAELERAVAAATSLAGVFREFGLQVGGGAWQRMREHIERSELDTSHFSRGLQPPPRADAPSWTDDGLRGALTGARSVSEVMRRLGLSVNAHAQRRRIVERIEELGSPTEQLPGRRWAAGREGGGRRRRPLEEILVTGRSVRRADSGNGCSARASSSTAAAGAS